MKVALVHDWLTGMRGGERVLEALCELFPDAPVYTLLWIRGSVSPVIEGREVHTSLLQRMPVAGRNYRWYLPLFPAFIHAFDLSAYDLVISTSHCVAKGVRVGEQTVHVSYVHAPMRYVWDKYFDYFGKAEGVVGRIGPMNPLLNRLRKWDYRTSSRVDHFIANSANIARKIRVFYNREAEVIHPPVDCNRFAPGKSEGEFYLYVGAFVPYKRVDLAVDACRRLKRPLVLIGSGPGERALRRRAGECRWIRFAGWQGPEQLARYYRRSRALLFPADEDFGITPVESMASGRPVVALARGGALESLAGEEWIGAGDHPVRVTGGVLFPCQDVDSLVEGIQQLESERFDRKSLRRQAEQFDRKRFKEKIRQSLQKNSRKRMVAADP